MDGGCRWPGLLQRQPFDNLLQLRRQAMATLIYARPGCQTGKAIAAITLNPAPDRSIRDALSKGCRLQRRLPVQKRLDDLVAVQSSVTIRLTQFSQGCFLSIFSPHRIGS